MCVGPVLLPWLVLLGLSEIRGHVDVTTDTYFSDVTWSLGSSSWSWDGGAVNGYIPSGSSYTSITVTIGHCTFDRLTCGGEDGQGNGGAVAVKSGTLNLDTCNFTSCVALLSGGAIFVRTSVLSATGCRFEACSAPVNGGAIAVIETAQKNLSLKKCVVENCQTSGSFVLFFDAIGTAKLEENTIEDSDSSNNCILSMTCNSFTWLGNKLLLSVSNESASVIKIVCEQDVTLIEESTFSNDGKQVRRFFDVNQRGEWKFDHCSFTSIMTPEEGTAILINAENGVDRLDIIDCNFTGLSCRWNGGAIHVRHIEFSMVGCLFDSCESREGWSEGGVELGGGGGVYIEWSARGELQDCTFVNNTGNINGQSLQIMIAHDVTEKPQVTVSNCTFKDHKSPSVLCFGKYANEYSNSLASSSFKYTIFNCTFENNVYDSDDFGLVLARSRIGLSYEDCIFRGNQGKLLYVSKEESGSPSFDMSNCSFEDCRGTGLVFSREGVSVGGVSFTGCNFSSCEALILELQSLGDSLTLFDCSFLECHTEASKSSICVIEKPNLAVDIRNCVFEMCGGSDGSAISIVCEDLTLISNEFNGLREGSGYGIQVGLVNKEKELSFDHCKFSNNGANVTEKFINISDEHKSVSFIDCEFREMGATTGGGALKLNLVQEGAKLSLLRCVFFACYCKNDGGAIHGQGTNTIIIEECTFQECYCLEGYPEAGGGGAVYIKYTTKSATVSHCKFINNTSPRNGQSVELQCVPGYDTFYESVTLFNCSFLNHAYGSIVCFVYSNGDNVILFNSTQDYTLSSCIFQGNEMKPSPLSDYGVFTGSTTGDIRYEDCQFISNTGLDGTASCLIALHHKCATCSVEHCNFTDCHHDGSDNAIVCLRQTVDGQTTIKICDCAFRGCSCASGMISVLSASLTTLDISNNQFITCESKTSSSVLLANAQSSVSELSFNNNVVSACQGKSDAKIGSIVTISPTQLSFNDNRFDVAESGQFCIYVDMKMFTGVVVVEECVFKNGNGDLAGQDAQFLHFARSHGLKFVSCIFESIQSWGRGAIYFRRQAGTMYQLEVFNCTFNKCIMRGLNGGAAIWSGDVDTISVENCTFELCESEPGSDGGGAVYIDHSTKQGIIVNCTFVDNKNKGKGMSVAVFTQPDAQGKNDPSRIEFSECIFKDHKRPEVGAILFFFYGTQSSQLYSGQYKLSSCTFENNLLTDSAGLVNLETQQIHYHNCTFYNTGNKNIYGGLLRIAVGTEQCTLESCVFKYDAANEPPMQCLLVLGEQIQTLSLISSIFSGLFVASGLATIKSSNARNLATLCDTFTISACDFTQCKANEANPLLDISVSSGMSKIQDTLFAVSASSNPLFAVSCDSNAQIEFYNCCFTHSQDLGSAYITINNIAGKVIFSDVCFDVEESQAIKYLGGKDNVEFSGGNREGFFVDCQCWEPVDTAGPPTEEGSSSVMTEESETTPPESESSGTDEPGPDSGTGNKSNAGLIAGVVIGIIVIIVIVVVVILLLLRRRRTEEEEDEGVTAEQEFTEETVTTATQGMPVAGGEWSQTTEDNPVFLNDGVDETEGPFHNMFEEDGLFTE